MGQLASCLQDVLQDVDQDLQDVTSIYHESLSRCLLLQLADLSFESISMEHSLQIIAI